MSRKALIISNPGEIGKENYCEGVNKDVTNYKNFLKSPIGGLWYNYEIEELFKPSSNTVKQAIQGLRGYDYAKVIFCGHGYYLNPWHDIC